MNKDPNLALSRFEFKPNSKDKSEHETQSKVFKIRSFINIFFNQLKTPKI